MKKRMGVISLGIALFTMFFGAGNIVFPLALGREMGDKIVSAMPGFVLAAVAIPLFGLISALLFEGNYKKFLANIGKVPGAILAFICMIFLMGPLGGIPRCLVLSYAAVQTYIPYCPLFLYLIFALAIIFVLTFRENRVVSILGRFLGPLKVLLLLSIIALGLWSFGQFSTEHYSHSESFLRGIEKGYFTLDLIGAIFFSHLIYEALRQERSNELIAQPKKVMMLCLKAALLCGILLGMVYWGFGIVAGMYGKEIMGVPQDQILSVLSMKILGNGVGVLANITVAVACLTTAVALTTVVSDYIHYELSKEKFPYVVALLITIFASFLMSNLGFEGIMKIIGPVAITLYPSMIMLAGVNILQKFFAFRYVKTAVFSTLLITIFVQYVL